jgi:hypothetical protein
MLSGSKYPYLSIFRIISGIVRIVYKDIRFFGSLISNSCTIVEINFGGGNIKEEEEILSLEEEFCDELNMGDNECLTLGGDKDDFLKLTEGKDETE